MRKQQPPLETNSVAATLPLTVALVEPGAASSAAAALLGSLNAAATRASPATERTASVSMPAGSSTRASIRRAVPESLR